MKETIFTKIVKGEIPCHKVYEDDHTLAFMDIHPVAEGHVLVVPKKQVECIWDLDLATYDAVMRTVRKVGIRLKQVVGKPYVGTVVVGTDVPHAHVHVVPFTESHELQRAFSPISQGPDHTALAALAAKIHFSA